MTYVVWHHYFNSLPTLHSCMRHSWWFTQVCPISWHPSFRVDGKSRCNGVSIIIYRCQPLIHKPCGAEFRGTIWFLGTPVITQPEWTFIRGWHYSTLLTIQPSTYWTTQWIYHSNTESLTSKSDHFHNIHHKIQLVWLCVNTYQTILRKMNIINPSQRTSVITQGIPWCFDP